MFMKANVAECSDSFRIFAFHVQFTYVPTSMIVRLPPSLSHNEALDIALTGEINIANPIKYSETFNWQLVPVEETQRPGVKTW
jgi:hypothetical protein